MKGEITGASRALFLIYGVFLVTFVLTLAHLQLTLFADNVGFSSNSAYSYGNRHPRRAAARTAVLVCSPGGVVIAIFLLAKSRQALINALLLMAAVTALWVLVAIGIVGLTLIFEMLRRGGNGREAAVIGLISLLPLVALVAVAMLLRGRGRMAWISKLAAGLMLLQGVWILFGGMMAAVTGMMAFACGGALTAALILLSRERPSH